MKAVMYNNTKITIMFKNIIFTYAIVKTRAVQYIMRLSSYNFILT